MRRAVPSARIAGDTPGSRARRRWSASRDEPSSLVTELKRTLAHVEAQAQAHIDHKRTEKALPYLERAAVLRAQIARLS